MEKMVRRQGLRASQQPTNGTLGNAGVSMGWQPQRLPGKSEGPTGGTTGDHSRGTWTDGSSKTLLTETEVTDVGELDVDNVEVGKTYLRMGRLHIRDDTTRILHGSPKGT